VCMLVSLSLLWCTTGSTSMRSTTCNSIYTATAAAVCMLIGKSLLWRTTGNTVAVHPQDQQVAHSTSTHSTLPASSKSSLSISNQVRLIQQRPQTTPHRITCKRHNRSAHINDVKRTHGSPQRTGRSLLHSSRPAA
jgi:ABC-type nickel/cobalt efflux system permease component RcnA